MKFVGHAVFAQRGVLEERVVKGERVTKNLRNPAP